jgi:hypothetical protein
MNLNAPRQLTGFVFHFFQLHRRHSSPSTVQRHRGAALDAAGHLGGRIDDPIAGLALRAGTLPPAPPHTEAGARMVSAAAQRRTARPIEYETKSARLGKDH